VARLRGIEIGMLRRQQADTKVIVEDGELGMKR